MRQAHACTLRPPPQPIKLLQPIKPPRTHVRCSGPTGNVVVLL